MSRTYLALLHYDGRDFVGWQRQPKGRSVQAEVEGVLERLCGRRVVAHGAGRTDAGVHAMGLGVSFSVPARWGALELRRALNALLPRDCWVEQIRPVLAGFHARKSASGRRYRYDVGTDPAAFSPFRRPYEWALGRTLDERLLRDAAGLLPGRRDFRAFAVRKGDEPGGRTSGPTEEPAERIDRVPLGPYECTVKQAAWAPREGNRGFSFHIAADRFLHHMVRFLVGTMVDIGLGRRPPGDMTTLLAAPGNQDTSPPAPPQGLFFVEAEYGAEWFTAEGTDLLETHG